MKAPNTFDNLSRGSLERGESLPKSRKVQICVSRLPPPPTPIEMKFRTIKRTHVPLGRAKFYVNRCNKSPLRVNMLIFDV